MGSEADKRILSGTVAFTGRLASMRRTEAFALVRAQGGAPRRGVTRSTNVLVVGELGWPLLADGQPSKSLSLARTYEIEIASERRFLEWLGRAVPDDQLRNYGLDQIASLSGLPPQVVEELTAFGLLDARGGLYRFRDLSVARQMAELFAAGIALSTITKSIQDIRRWLPDSDLSRVKLYPSSQDKLIVEHLKVRSDQSGQMALPVAEPADSPDVLFEQAQAAEADEDFAAAARLYRRVMSLDPTDATAAFNLGNLLTRAGRKAEAERAFKSALKADRRFPEAWYNLANLYDEQDRVHDAIDALQRALAIDPDYADAVFNLALILQRRNRHAEAAQHWRRYIALDAQSDWAARARRALKLCEMQIAQSS
ncbi:MAG TPA: tetratricopeptide repeat protein [Xanthobacteraceae bacterium]|nr:tetratricopeptide repeat protein [Xanthobacteraceae bacterium]